MAVTETVKIVFEVDNKAITDTVGDLAQVGKVAQDDAAKFKQLGEASKQASKDMDGLAKSTKAVTDSGKEVGKNAEGFVSLRTRVREAKEEVQRLSEEFGEFSTEANAARQRAGLLADEMSDLNRQVNLLNPESKIKAFSALGSGVVGAFQVATGALQAFGAENEEVQKIAQKLQGALNVVQGVQSIVQLKEAYKDVQVVLGFTATAQQALNVAQVEGAAASGAAAGGVRTLSAALAANPIGAIAIAIGALAGAYLLLRDNTDEATEAQEANNELSKTATDLKKRQRDATLDLALAEGKITQAQFDKAKANSKEEEELTKLINTYKGIKTQIDANTAANKRSAELVQAGLKSTRESGAITAKTEQENIERRSKANKALEVQLIQADKNIKAAIRLGQTERAAIDAREQKNAEKSISTSRVKEKQLKSEAKAQQEVRKETELQLIPNSKIEEQQKKINEELEKTGPIAKRSLGDWKGSAQELIDEEEKLAKKQQETREIYFAVASELSQLALIGVQNQTDAELESLEKRKEQGLISEEKYQAGVKKLRQKAAEDQKKAAIFQATLDVAAALINALTFKPSNAVPAALILATITATANLAKIVATPIPKFNKGTLSVPGIDTGGDSVHAMLRPGEAVIPTDTNRAYAPAIKAIYQKQIKPSDINAFVLNKLSGKGSIGRDTAITASVDTFALSKALSKNKTVEVGNASVVGRVIANEILKAYNPRR